MVTNWHKSGGARVICKQQVAVEKPENLRDRTPQAPPDPVNKRRNIVIIYTVTPICESDEEMVCIRCSKPISSNMESFMVSSYKKGKSLFGQEFFDWKSMEAPVCKECIDNCGK